MRIEDTGLKWKYGLTPIKSYKKVVIHHPAHPTWDINDIHRAHQNKGWNGMGYNYFITKDGRIQLGRGMNIGAHCEGHNSNTLGVSFQGNFETQIPTETQYKSGAQLIAKLLKDAGLNTNDVIGHRDLAATVCPGKNFDLSKWKQYILAVLNPTKGVASVKATDATKNAIENLAKYGIMQQGYEVTKDYEIPMISMMNGLVKAIESGNLKN